MSVILICNIIVWFWPLFFFRGLRFLSYLFVAYLFSQSYYLQPLIYELFGIDYWYGFPIDQLGKISLYSALSGFIYSLTFYVFSKNIKTKSRDIVRGPLNFILGLFPRSKIVLFVYFVSFIYLAYLIYSVSFYIGDLNRYQWWYGGYREQFGSGLLFIKYLLPILIFWVFNAFSKSKKFAFILNFCILFMAVVFVSFDGSRRELVLPLLSFLVFSVRCFQLNNRGIGIFYLGSFVFFILFIAYAGISRSVVGWSAILGGVEGVNLGHFFSGLLSPMPTVYVSGSMIEYISSNGVQGFGSYFSAVVNAIFPHFIFGYYVGGQPLVLEMHNQLGWVGRDFGFLAEAIYAGSWYAVALMHFLVAVYHSFIFNLVVKINTLACFLFFVFFHVALIQSLRSDFMNLLKWAVYPAVFLVILFFVIRALRWFLKKAY